MDQNSSVFGNEDSRLFHEKVLRHDIQQAEEELEDIRWKQRDLLTRHKKYIRRYLIPLIILAILLLVAIFDFEHRLDIDLSLGKWAATLHIRRWIFLIATPLIVFFTVVCYGVFGKTDKSVFPDRIAGIFRLRNICTLQRQYEAELAEKKNDLSGLKKEMWDLQQEGMREGQIQA